MRILLMIIVALGLRYEPPCPPAHAPRQGDSEAPGEGSELGTQLSSTRLQHGSEYDQTEQQRNVQVWRNTMYRFYLYIFLQIGIDSEARPFRSSQLQLCHIIIVIILIIILLHVCVYIYICRYICMCVCVCRCIYIYICIHIYIYTHICMCVYI